MAEYQRDYRSKLSPEKLEEKRKQMREYYHSHKDVYSKYAKKYAKTKKGHEALERARQKERDNLTDNYIRQFLWTSLYNAEGVKIKRKNIPQEQVEKYRQSILAQRQLKELKNGTKSKT